MIEALIDSLNPLVSICEQQSIREASERGQETADKPASRGTIISTRGSVTEHSDDVYFKQNESAEGVCLGVIIL